jgi:glycosyltransferase involved in cell wall biosynthesis
MVLTKAQGAFLEMLNPDVNLINLNYKKPHFSLPGLVKYINNSQPDVLLSSLDLSNLIALVASRLSKNKPHTIIRIASTVSVQFRSKIKKTLEKTLLKALYPTANTIIAVSNGVADDLATYIGLPRQRIQTLYNPIITSELLEKAKEPLDHPWFHPDSPPVVVGVGRLTMAKNFPLLIRAFAHVRENIDARLIILGEGEERIKLENIIKELRIDTDVQLPGFVYNPYQYLSNASAFCMSSNWEGLPTALVEAMACKCPVIATDCPSGPNEILAGGKYGYLVPKDDEEALANAIKSTLSGDIREVESSWLTQFHIDTYSKRFNEIFTNLSSFGP